MKFTDVLLSLTLTFLDDLTYQISVINKVFAIVHITV